MSATVEFRLLGPVEVWAGGRRVDTGQPRQRSVLAALLVDAGRLVTWESLIDRVWGEAPPAGARHALYSHVARVRRLLAAAAGPGEAPPRLVRQPGGYLLDVDPDRVDLHRFRRLVDQARARNANGERVLLLREAVELWRGEPLAGLPGRWPARLREGWRQRRLEAVLAWALAELDEGNAAAVIAPLTELLDDYPLVEPVSATLIQALHRTGRGAQALACYEAARQGLRDELGVAPGGELRDAYQLVLGSGPARPAAPGAAPAPLTPAQLPLDLHGFVGRRAELAMLNVMLAAATEQPTAVVVAAVWGPAGVGKTTLAVHWAHRVADRFPDGQLYVDLRGFDPPGPALTAAEAVRGFLDGLGVAPRRVPASLDAQVALYRSLLAGRRVLIVLDNARDAGQVRPLLPGSPGCLAVVTSRNQLPSLVAMAGARPLTLGLLPAADAQELLARRLGAHRVAAEPQAVGEILSRCARLPLALATVAARAATHPDFPLDALAGELRRSCAGLDAFTGDDPATDVRAVFSWSYRQLQAPAARLFRLLAVHPGPDISAPAAASLAGTPAPAAGPLLTELTRAHLVTEHALGRYACHDLLRAYAGELAQECDSDADRRAATGRVLDHYLHTARAAVCLLEPHRDQAPVAPARAGVVPERLADPASALAWFAAEHPVLLAAVRQAASCGFDTHAWQLAGTMADFFQRRGDWAGWAVTQRTALAAARRLADPAKEAEAHRGLSGAYYQLGRLDEAHIHLRHAVELHQRLSDPASQARIMLNLAWLNERQGRLADAVGNAGQALDLYRAAGHRRGEAAALNALAWCHVQLGNHGEALACGGASLTLLRELDDRHGQAAALDSLGYINHHLGRHEQAAAGYRQALELFQQVGDGYNEATTLRRLAETQRDAGDLAAAGQTWRRAVAILDGLGHADADLVRAALRRLDAAQPVRASR